MESLIKKGDKIKLNNICYEVIEQKGQGGSGSVFLVKNNNEKYAVKFIKIQKNKDIKRFYNECEHITKIKNKSVIKYISYGNYSEKEYYILMPFYNNTLKDVLKENLNIVKKINICRKIIQAFVILHKNRIIHRDIKPENILIDEKLNVVLSDFGISHFPNSNLTERSERLANFDFHAPEQKKNSYYEHGYYTDIYSLGLLLNYIFTSEIPMGKKYQLIRDFYPEYFKIDYLISRMTKQNHNHRIQSIIIVKVYFEKIVSEIKNNLFDIEENLKDDFYSNLEFGYKISKKKLRNIFKIASKDIYLIDSISKSYYGNMMKYNSNYNMIIGYRTSDFLKFLCIQLKILNICENKFTNEDSGYSGKIENTFVFFENEDNKKKYLEKLMNILSKYEIKESRFCSIKGRIIHLFLSCKYYHCPEILDSINRDINEWYDKLSDSPIVYLYEFINGIFQNNQKYDYLLKDIKIFENIYINWYRTKSQYEKKDEYDFNDLALLDNIYTEKKENTKRIIDKIKEKYKEYDYDFDEEDKNLKIIFSSIKKFEKFQKMIMENSKKDYILEGDVLEILNTFEYVRGNIQITLNYFDIEKVIPQVIKL